MGVCVCQWGVGWSRVVVLLVLLQYVAIWAHAFLLSFLALHTRVVLTPSRQMGKRASRPRDVARMRAYNAQRASEAQYELAPAPESQSIFLHTVEGFPMIYNPSTKSSTWAVDGTSMIGVRPASDLEIEHFRVFEREELLYSWVWRKNGIMKGGYWYCHALGRTKCARPWGTWAKPVSA